jgi:hypothetical protein
MDLNEREILKLNYQKYEDYNEKLKLIIFVFLCILIKNYMKNK